MFVGGDYCCYWVDFFVGGGVGDGGVGVGFWLVVGVDSFCVVWYIVGVVGDVGWVGFDIVWGVRCG